MASSDAAVPKLLWDFLFSDFQWSKFSAHIISGYIGPIFTTVSPYGRYLAYITDLTFSRLLKGRCHATNFRVKIGEIGLLTFIRCIGVPKQLVISQFGFQKVHLQLFIYIVYKFGEIPSNNPGV